MFIRPIVELMVREGEPDGAAAGAPPPSQPDPSTPAVAAAPASADPDAAGAATAGEEAGSAAGEGAGAEDGEGEGEEAPRELPTPETVEALIELFPETFRNHPKFAQLREADAQQAVDRALTQQRQQPELDPVYQQAVDVGNRSVAELARVVAELDDVDAEKVTGHVLTHARAVEVKERQAAFVVVDALAQHALSDLVTRDAESDEFKAVDQAYSEAIIEYRRLLNSDDPKNRQKALAAFTQRTQQLIKDQALKVGEGRGVAKERRASKQREAIIRDNAVTAAQAQVAAGRQPPAPPKGGAAPASKTLTREKLLTGGWRETKKVMQAAGHKI